MDRYDFKTTRENELQGAFIFILLCIWLNFIAQVTTKNYEP